MKDNRCLQYIVREINNGQSILTVLKKELNMSSDLIRKVRDDQGVLLNGKNAFLSQSVTMGDYLELYLLSSFGKSDIEPCTDFLKVLYEDDWILAVDKPAGIIVHPITFEAENTLANLVRHYQMQKGEDYTIRPVSRLDRDTSGIVLFAKSQYIQHVLQLQNKSGTFEKVYMTLVQGVLNSRHNFINEKIGRKNGSIIEREVSDAGKTAVTEYTLIKQYCKYALLKVKIHTGRTHQIRVHMSHIGHPILGDVLYGYHEENQTNRLSPENLCNDNIQKRHLLHAYKLRFIHPVTKKTVEIKSFLPNDFKETIKSGII